MWIPYYRRNSELESGLMPSARGWIVVAFSLTHNADFPIIPF
jgi:hypothetical protein